MSIVNRVAESGLIQFDPATLVKDMVVSVVSLSDFLQRRTHFAGKTLSSSYHFP